MPSENKSSGSTENDPARDPARSEDKQSEQAEQPEQDAAALLRRAQAALARLEALKKANPTWGLLSEKLIGPPVGLALLSGFIYFLALSYWRSYLSALHIESSWFDPSLTRLISFSAPGLLGAAVMTAAYFLFDGIKRNWTFFGLLAVWILGLGYISGTFQVLGVPSKRTIWFSFQMTLLAALPLALRYAPSSWFDWLFGQDDELRRLRASVAELHKLQGIEQKVGALELEASILAMRKNIAKQRIMVFLPGVFVFYCLTALPIIARYHAYGDIVHARYVHDGASLLVTDGSSAAYSIRTAGDCGVFVRLSASGTFVSLCPDDLDLDEMSYRPTNLSGLSGIGDVPQTPQPAGGLDKKASSPSQTP